MLSTGKANFSSLASNDSVIEKLPSILRFVIYSCFILSKKKREISEISLQKDVLKIMCCRENVLNS